ncbi:PLDc_N domain-containing protein [Spiractinospora alimapuensis]|uniref:PLD nuclease N-terminal domain-containing protein n=1 Tax=Spiractinospora alimapuensis TaxID=2820884 RepID=UPI001F23CD84|nr:PLD nuclease N-terminal domain-containing protein [Spiractinospora alimapuensis]QVQ50980.1 PLDc_N domain-containing protein [Spiractinospora alimapuensis]
MVLVGVALALAAVVLWVYSLFDALTTPSTEVRTLPKLAWVAVIVLLLQIGALLWLFFGRPRVLATSNAAPTAGPASGTPSSPKPTGGTQRGGGPIGPDDDPDFLRDINRRINPED